MIYLDNAATSWPKPESVYREVGDFLRRAGANPGRGGHALARAASEMVESVRQELATFFHVSRPEQFVFTSNATDALNLAIKGTLNPGDHVVTSSLEHNSVLRPLYHLSQERDVSYTVVEAGPDGLITAEEIIAAVTLRTKLIVLTHASNVTGGLLPIEEVGNYAREKGIIFLVDAAQTAGEIEIDLEKLPVDMLALAGHKALMGPTGIGALYIREGVLLKSLKEGGTGTRSDLEHQPEEWPYKYESGTLNTSGIAGLGAALAFIKEVGLQAISQHIMDLTQSFLAGCTQIPGVKVYGPKERNRRVGVVSLNVENLNPDEVGFILDQIYGIAVRAGLHCAPLAHRSLGTYPQGSVRFSFGYFNTEDEVKAALQALREISEQTGG
ncbi:MAG: aminotransferase class V-fold PLP-dependent enzyme [Firmicutes bacterium]|nr:aminotransferase class V-fold PLP-dependent enzyme [Bacillota bacterium]